MDLRWLVCGMKSSFLSFVPCRITGRAVPAIAESVFQNGMPRSLPVRLFSLTFGAMSTLTVTAKGQITLRKDLLNHLGVQPGEKVAVEKLADGRIEVRAERPVGKIADVFNFLKRDQQPSLSIEDINEIAAQGWAGKR
jgi:AbrB family looped-hinge helix DNA binding protein